ncbi:class I SAM-dependent RNA methyltransferase [soil metagenome]
MALKHEPGYRRPVRAASQPAPRPAPPPGTVGFRPPFPAGVQTYFATSPRGLEAALAGELTAIGAAAIRAVPGGVMFEGDVPLGWRANLESRLASRILRRIFEFDYRDEHDVHRAASTIDWPALFDVGQTLRIDVVGRHSPLTSLDFTTLRIKDAICDLFRDRFDARPSIDTVAPDVRIHAFLDERRGTLYADLSGDTLFKRGWRDDKVAAPLRENLACGLLDLAGWTPDLPLIDPFCGSGTIAIEAAHIVQRRSPGLSRTFGFERLAGFDRSAWVAMREEALARFEPKDKLAIAASDIAPRAIGATRENKKRAHTVFAASVGDARTVASPFDAPGLLIANPPYGERAELRGDDPDEAITDDGFWAEFAANLKRGFPGWKVAILTSDFDLPKRMRLKPSRRHVLFNGAIECRLFVFEMVSGSNRVSRPGDPV